MNNMGGVWLDMEHAFSHLIDQPMTICGLCPISEWLKTLCEKSKLNLHEVVKVQSDRPMCQGRVAASKGDLVGVGPRSRELNDACGHSPFPHIAIASKGRRGGTGLVRPRSPDASSQMSSSCACASLHQTSS